MNDRPSAPPPQPPAVVLVVDDDDVDREAVVQSLEKAEIHVEAVEAATASEALLRATVSKPDCIVLDCQLPTASGDDVLRLFRSEGIDSPIIVLTGIADEKTAVRLMKAGVRDYLSKLDFTPENMARAVTHAIRLHRAEVASRRADARWRRHVAMLGQLAVVSPRLFAALSIEDLLSSAAQSMRGLFDAVRAMVVMRPGASSELRLEYAGEDGASGASAAIATDEAFWSALEKATDVLLLDAPATGERFARRYAAPVRERSGGVVGAAIVDRIVESDLDDAADRAVLLQFSHTLSVAVENARLFRSERNAVQAREEVLAIVSHDLRAPLGSVQLASSLIRELVPQEAEIGLVLDRMDAGVAHMQRLIEDLMDLAGIDAGTLNIERAPTPVDQVVELATSLMESAAKRKGIVLEAAVESGLPNVLADSKRIVQLLTNLLSNAIKHSPRGKAVRLSAGRAEQEVCFSVQDHGEGFGDDELACLFERFWQAEGRGNRGLGLGLYIAKAIVSAHQGRIWAESEPHRGAKFFFTLPIEILRPIVRRRPTNAAGEGSSGSETGVDRSGSTRPSLPASLPAARPGPIGSIPSRWTSRDRPPGCRAAGSGTLAAPAADSR